MELELKHLAGYLPYGFKIVCNTEEEQKIEEIYISTVKGIHLEGIDCIDGNNWDLTVKPILRPLSDLTKEIEVNGEKFVPIDYIKQISMILNYIQINNCFKYSNGDGTFRYVNIEYLPYLVIEKLYEWHFDTYSLIEKGLAIDKNTIV